MSRHHSSFSQVICSLSLRFMNFMPMFTLYLDCGREFVLPVLLKGLRSEFFTTKDFHIVEKRDHRVICEVVLRHV